MPIFYRQNKRYVSDLDAFLHAFDQKQQHASPAQQAEIAKHQRIAKLRDQADTEKQK